MHLSRNRFTLFLAEGLGGVKFSFLGELFNENNVLGETEDPNATDGLVFSGDCAYFPKTKTNT